jgi:hypothetical protein
MVNLSIYPSFRNLNYAPSHEGVWRSGGVAPRTINTVDVVTSEDHPASCTMGTGGPFPGDKVRPGRDAEHSPHLVQKSRMSRSYTSSLPLHLHRGVVGLL